MGLSIKGETCKKRLLLFTSAIGIFDIFFLKDCTKKVFKIYKSTVIEHFKPMPLCSIKWRPLKVSVILESPLLIANIVQSTLSGLIQFLATDSPRKLTKNAFHFISNALFVLKIFKLLSWLFGRVEKTG